MIIFLYGPDTYRSRQKLKEIVARYKNIHKTGMSFSDFSAEDNDFEDFQNAADAVSMFEEKRLLVLRDFVSSTDFADKFLSWEKKESIKDSKEIILVFADKAIIKSNAFFKWLSRNAQCQKFDTLRGAQLNRWAKRFAVEKEVRIEDSALYRLLSHTGGDLWAFENELKKLKSYTGGLAIRNENLDVFFRPALQSHIFSFMNSLAGGNKAKAFRLLRGHIEAGDNEHYIFFMIVKQFRNMAMREIARNEINYFTKKEIKKSYQRLVDLDISIKTGKLKAIEALENFILET